MCVYAYMHAITVNERRGLEFEEEEEGGRFCVCVGFVFTKEKYIYSLKFFLKNWRKKSRYSQVDN